MALTLPWQWRDFASLSGADWYAIAELRQAVFIVEQRCVYADLDGLDQRAWHLLGRDARGQLVAYCRVLAAGDKFAEPSIGRVLTAAAARRRGLGRALMHEAIRRLIEQYGNTPIRISAQQHLAAFYAEFGFTAASPPYDEDGIWHIDMLRSAP